MKKLVLTLIALLVAGLAIYGLQPSVDAKVTGVCSNCHTMHNSQDGQQVYNGNTAYLLKADCVACHTNSGNIGDNTIDIDGSTTAAGRFTNGAGDTLVHNVAGLYGVDGTLGNTPPGNTTALTSQLACYGTNGCHMRYSGTYHHSDTAPYRFLKLANGADVLGKESANREYDSTGNYNGANATNHNVYSASTSQGISRFCAECHPNFHGIANTGGSSPFLRHPTDNLIPPTWTGVTVDYNNNPFAFDGSDYNNASTTAPYTTTGARVACVSCHRAHGSAYADLLRFNYLTQNAGTGSSTVGCLGCHSAQR